MPPYFVEDPLYEQNFRRWAQDGDVILASGAKSGTAWISQIVHVLKSGDDDYLKVGDRDEQNEAIGTMEMVRYPGQTLEERVAAALAASCSSRVLSNLPCQKNQKATRAVTFPAN